MSRRLAAHKLPDNPTWIEFPRSDGNRKQWPTNTTKSVKGGEVNYMRPASIDESVSIHWRVAIGDSVAKALNMEAGPTYVLKEWPEGYHMFDHNKGKEQNPRHDAYLMGSTNVTKFRSANEFVPHVIWLLTDATLTHSECQCKYSTKKPQKEISSAMGLPMFRVPGGSPSPSAAGTSGGGGSISARRPKAPKAPSREQRPKDPKPYAGVRKAPVKPSKKLTGPTRSIVPDRDKDIIASLADGDITPARMFRKGELVWCHLDPPIPGLHGPETNIAFWPSIVESTSLKAEVVHKDEVQGEGAASQTQVPTEANIALPNTQWGRTPFPPPNAPAPLITWSTQHQNTYKLKLLGTPYVCTVYDEGVIPYLVYTPSNILLSTIREALEASLRSDSIIELDKKAELMFDFNPHGDDADIIKEEGDMKEKQERDRERFLKAVAPITLGIEISANLIKCWTPTDEWDAKITVPAILPTSTTNTTSGSTMGGAPMQSLQNALQEAMKSNARVAGASSSGNTTNNSNANSKSNAATGVNGSQGSEVYDARLGVDGIPKTIPHTITQLRYQGLWWGSERIWADELVRLKLARRQFAPKGTDTIYPPAGPSNSTLERVNPGGVDGESSGVQESELGAGDKGLFMKIDGMFVVDVPQTGGGVVKECRVSGMLYELVEEDWEEAVVLPTPPPSQQQATVGRSDNGKGKGRAVDVGEGISSGLPDNTQTPTPTQTPIQTQTQTQALGASSVPNLTQPQKGNLSSIRAGSAKERAAQEEAARPVLSTGYALPRAPLGFKFRAILPQGHEVVVSLSLISGRYYPKLFEHKLLRPMIEHAVQSSVDAEEGLYAYRHLWAMQGLVPGAYQSMDPVQWVGNRVLMLRQADERARDAFRTLIQHIKRQKQQEVFIGGIGDTEMVDAFAPEQGGSISAAA